jgi:hypothetical protein
LVGSTITSQFIVLGAFITRACGKRRWICSPSESVLDTNSEGGVPWEKSSGLAMSTSTRPEMLCAPADSSMAIEPAPLVAFTISSAWAVASSGVASATPGCASFQTLKGGLPR